MDAAEQPDVRGDIDPTEFLRAMLTISPEDAAKVHDDAADKMKPPPRTEGPAGDYGDDDAT